MEQSTIAIIIVVATCILYASEKLPVVITTILGMLAMAFFGVLSFADAFSGFSNSTVMLVLGMAVIVGSLFESGIAPKVGYKLLKIIGNNEKRVILVVMLIAASMSAFMVNTTVMAMFMPLLASIAASSSGKITKKNTYLPLAIGTLIGGSATLVGGTPVMLAQSVLEGVEGVEPMGFFEPALISVIVVIVIAICYSIFLYKFQVKCFDFPEVRDDTLTSDADGDTSSIADIKNTKVNKRNAVISSIVLVICITLFITGPFNVGLVSIAGAVILIILRCIDGKKAMRNMYWSTIFTLGAAIGFAKGFTSSGAGEKIVRFLISCLGTWITNPIVLVTLFLMIGLVLSQVMSNGALESMLAAIAVSIALEVKMNPMPLIMASLFGVTMAMATPTATVSITMAQSAGYRFKDYAKVGGLVGIIGSVTAGIAIVLIYKLY